MDPDKVFETLCYVSEGYKPLHAIKKVFGTTYTGVILARTFALHVIASQPFFGG